MPLTGIAGPNGLTSQRSSQLSNPRTSLLSPAAAALKAQAKAADDAKLIFGAVFSLRRLVQQLGGSDDAFLNYRTAEYKLHYFETPTQLKFIMLTDTRTGSMRTVLHQIWATLYVEYVVKSPLSPIEHTGGKGVANELFEGGLESFMVSTSAQLLRIAPSADEFSFHSPQASIFNIGQPPIAHA